MIHNIEGQCIEGLRNDQAVVFGLIGSRLKTLRLGFEGDIPFNLDPRYHINLILLSSLDFR
jgi:hypothetical protein